MAFYRGVYRKVPSNPSKEVMGMSTRQDFLRVWP